jgi:NAD(P)-dependent dehydrogenase (short-subunit alcohol dehydrogenase family)
MEIVRGSSAVVTGGGSGIGRSIVLALAAEGVHVVIADLDGEAAEAVAAEVSALGVRGLAHRTDVSKLDDVEALAEVCYGELGSVEILVNNAGVTLRPFRASWNASIDDFRWVMDVNFWGVLHGHHVFVPRMLERPGPKHIVNTSSAATFVTIAGHSAYSASKAAVDGFSLCARAELEAHGIGVTLLHPSRVQTGIFASERFRDPAQQSQNRDVAPWIDALHPPGYGGAVPDPASSRDPTVAREPLEAISPARIGAMVVRGIQLNLPHVLTHPAPIADIAARTQDLLDGVGLLDEGYAPRQEAT